MKIWWRRVDSNHRHRAYETPALPTELRRHGTLRGIRRRSAHCRRTHDKRSQQVMSSAACASRGLDAGLHVEQAPLHLVPLALAVFWFVLRGTVGSEGFQQPNESSRAQRYET